VKTSRSDDATTGCVDWLTATVPYPDHAALTPASASRLAACWPGQSVIGKARPYPRNYAEAVALSHGVLSWHNEERRMRVCLNMNGGNLAAYYQDGHDMRELLHAVWSGFGRFTRIDIAIDYHRPADIAALIADIDADRTCTRAGVVTPYQQLRLDTPGDALRTTGVYIGSRSSDRYLCVYDKAVQLDLSDELWTRIELRNRHAKAEQLGLAGAHGDVVAAARGVMRAHTYPDTAWWRDALDGDCQHVAPVPRKDTDTARWLIETVAPVLVQELRHENSLTGELLKTYQSIVGEHIWRLNHPLD
jgi:hypothetical protein